MVRKNTIRGTISPTAEKWIRGAAILAMVVVALSSAILSFDGLQKLALESRIPANLAFLFPIAIDVTILMGSLAVLLYEMFGFRPLFGWFTVLFGTALSVTGNVISVADAGITAQVLHGIIPILLCISLESLLRILRFNIKQTISIERETDSTHPLNAPTTESAVGTYIEQFDTPEASTFETTFASDNSKPGDTPLSNSIPVSQESEIVLNLDESLVLTPEPTTPSDTPDLGEPTPVFDSVASVNIPVYVDPEKVKVETSKKATTPVTKKRAPGKHEPLTEEERNEFKSIVDGLPDDYPAFKKLGEVVRIKSEISHPDIRFIMGYPEDKRVDTLAKRAREFAAQP